MQRVIDEMRRAAENHRSLNEPVPIPLLTLERWIEELERATLGIGNQAQEVEDIIDRLAELIGDEPETSAQTTMEVG